MKIFKNYDGSIDWIAVGLVFIPPAAIVFIVWLAKYECEIKRKHYLQCVSQGQPEWLCYSATRYHHTLE